MFINAGFSEIHMVSQLILLAIICASTPALIMGLRRLQFRLFIGVGLIGTIASLAIYLAATGSSTRIENMIATDWSYPMRNLPQLAARSITSIFDFWGHEGTFAGFMMLFGTGLLLALNSQRPMQVFTLEKNGFLGRSPLLIGLSIQLYFVPLLWSHSSNDMQVFGRFSYGYMVVVIINSVFILAYLFVIWRRRRIHTFIRQRRNGFMLYSSVILLIVLGLFVLTQLRAIHYIAAGYLFTSALVLIMTLAWQMRNAFAGGGARQTWLVACLFSLAILVFFAIPVIAGLYVVGTIFERVFVLGIHLQVVSGLIWGSYTGYLLRQNNLATGSGSNWIRGFTAIGFTFTVSIVLGLVLTQVSLIADYATFAREWDARHQRIIQLRDSGSRDIEVTPYSYDLSVHISPIEIHPDGTFLCEPRFYGVQLKLKDES